jgi:hypothetical protein
MSVPDDERDLEADANRVGPQTLRHQRRTENGNLLGHGSGCVLLVVPTRIYSVGAAISIIPFRINCTLTGPQSRMTASKMTSEIRMPSLVPELSPSVIATPPHGRNDDRIGLL